MAKSWKVSSVEEYDSVIQQIKEQDTVIWKNGNYPDVVLNLKNNSICFMAETPGKVIFTGKSSVRISADRVHFSGFQFLNGSVSGNVVSVSGSFNKISHINISDYRSHYYFEITKSGQHNEVSHCHFEKKPQALPGKEGTSVFQVAVDSLHPGYNEIRWCSFSDFQAPEGAGGDYGMEAFRPGYSYQSKFVSRTLMEFCYFTRCNGDGEIISNKARENVYRYNTFESNGESHVTLRHGSNTAVYGNFFLDGAGIRIKEGQNDRVYNNYFHTGNYFSIRLENYRVDPLRNILIAHNTLVESGPMRLGGKGEYPPEEVVICNNLFIRPTGKMIEDPTGRETVQGNYSGELTSEKGFFVMKHKLFTNDYGYIQPENSLPSVKIRKESITGIPEPEDDPGIHLDIAKNKRPGKKSAGCYEPLRNGKPVRPAATANNTGPSYHCKTPEQNSAVLNEQVRRIIRETRKETIRKADSFLAEKPVTVTASFSPRSAGGIHDFYSEGDYWWPDPANPEGPYIQKDGQSYPDNFSDHRLAMIRLSEITATLTSAWLLTGKQQYSGKALEHFEAWFSDTATLMNPDMLYAQAIKGRFTGRSIGLIDAYHLVEVAQSVRVLSEKGAIPADKAEKIKNWFSRFLTWMTTHEYGVKEMNAENNHGTCWVVTAAAFARLTGNQTILELCKNRVRNILLPAQMAADGSFPLEIKRTKPYGYSLFNMDAFANAAYILSTPEDNLWDYTTPDGKSLRKGMEFIFPFMEEKSKWPFSKDIYIWEEWPARQSCLLFAGLALNNRKYIDTYLTLPADPSHPEVIRNLPVRHPLIWLNFK